VKETFDKIEYMTTDSIRLGYRCSSAVTKEVKTARNELTAKTLKNKNIADTAAALELYNAVLPGDCVLSCACREHHSPKMVKATATQVTRMFRIKLLRNLARGCIAKESEAITATRYPELPKTCATGLA